MTDNSNDERDTWERLDDIAFRSEYDGEMYEILRLRDVEDEGPNEVLAALEQFDNRALESLLKASREHELETGIQNRHFRDMHRIIRKLWWTGLRELHGECLAENYRVDEAKSALQLGEITRFDKISADVDEFSRRVSEQINEVRKLVRAKLRDYLSENFSEMSTEDRKRVAEDLTDILKPPSAIWEMKFAPRALVDMKMVYDRSGFD